MSNNLSAYPSIDELSDYERIEPGRILVVDDEIHASSACAFALTKVGGHSVRETTSPTEALQIAKDWRPDVILLDILMPETNGLELAKILRDAECDAQLMFVTGKDSTTDRIRGLRVGDQYLTKPFHPMMLLEMVDSLLRGRRRKLETASQHSDTNDWRPIFESNLRTVTIPPDRMVDLSPRLWEVLYTLVEANGAYVSKQQLLRDLWKGAGASSLVDVTVSRLRREIEIDPSHPELIITASGGYYYNIKRSQH